MNTDTHHWVPDVNAFDVRLALIRHTKRWNLKEAALACGLNAQSWREWELSGRRPRDYEAVCGQIAQRTGCDLVWLMTGRLPNHEPPGQTTVWAERQDVVPMSPSVVNPAPAVAASSEVEEDASRYVALAESQAPPGGLEPPTLRSEVVYLALVA